MLFYDLTGVDEIVRGGKRPTWHKATDGRTDEEGGSARGKNRPTSDGEEERTCEGERERESTERFQENIGTKGNKEVRSEVIGHRTRMILFFDIDSSP